MNSESSSPEQDGRVVRVPASSANLGAGFDVLGMALSLYADFGTGAMPPDAAGVDEFHPASVAFVAAGGRGPLWIRSSIPMARGLGFSGAVRVGGAALALVQQNSGDPAMALGDEFDQILRISTELEGHGDNAAASLCGGIVASVDGRAIPLRVGPVMAEATVVVWIPEVTTSTDKSRAGLPASVERTAATHNLGRVAQFVIAVEHDDPSLLRGATADQLHQMHRLANVAGASEALEAGVAAGAWCGWLSGSGPTVAFLCESSSAAAVADSLPDTGHFKELKIDLPGLRLLM